MIYNIFGSSYSSDLSSFFVLKFMSLSCLEFQVIFSVLVILVLHNCMICHFQAMVMLLMFSFSACDLLFYFEQIVQHCGLTEMMQYL